MSKLEKKNKKKKKREKKVRSTHLESSLWFLIKKVDG